MFEKGEYIVYGHNGICEVEDITHLNLSGVDKGKLYYVLAPLNKKESRIYYPVDREKDGRARRTITRAEAEQLLNEIPRIALIEVVNDKMREDIYKPVSYTHLDVYKRQDAELLLLLKFTDSKTSANAGARPCTGNIWIGYVTFINCRKIINRTIENRI